MLNNLTPGTLRGRPDGGYIGGKSGGSTFENGGPRDEVIGTGGDHGAGGLRPDAAVDLDLDLASARHFAHSADLVERIGDETLPTEARIDAHHQHQIDEVEH